MYFVTVYVAKGTRKHFGPFTSIEEGNEWASNYIRSDEAIRRYGCGRWENGYMETPTELAMSTAIGQPRQAQDHSA